MASQNKRTIAASVDRLSRRAQPLPDDVLELQQLAFCYFLDRTNVRNGLVADNTRACVYFERPIVGQNDVDASAR